MTVIVKSSKLVDSGIRSCDAVGYPDKETHLRRLIFENTAVGVRLEVSAASNFLWLDGNHQS